MACKITHFFKTGSYKENFFSENFLFSCLSVKYLQGYYLFFSIFAL